MDSTADIAAAAAAGAAGRIAAGWEHDDWARVADWAHAAGTGAVGTAVAVAVADADAEIVAAAGTAVADIVAAVELERVEFAQEQQSQRQPQAASSGWTGCCDRHNRSGHLELFSLPIPEGGATDTHTRRDVGEENHIQEEHGKCKSLK